MTRLELQRGYSASPYRWAQEGSCGTGRIQPPPRWPRPCATGSLDGGPLQDAADDVHQVVGLEWLGDVLVGAELPGPDAVDVARLRRAHHHPWALGPAPELGEDEPAVEHRHHDVEHDDVVRPSGDRARRRPPVSGQRGGEAP